MLKRSPSLPTHGATNQSPVARLRRALRLLVGSTIFAVVLAVELGAIYQAGLTPPLPVQGAAGCRIWINLADLDATNYDFATGKMTSAPGGYATTLAADGYTNGLTVEVDSSRALGYDCTNSGLATSYSVYTTTSRYHGGVAGLNSNNTANTTEGRYWGRVDYINTLANYQADGLDHPDEVGNPNSVFEDSAWELNGPNVPTTIGTATSASSAFAPTSSASSITVWADQSICASANSTFSTSYEWVRRITTPGVIGANGVISQTTTSANSAYTNNNGTSAAASVTGRGACSVLVAPHQSDTIVYDNTAPTATLDLPTITNSLTVTPTTSTASDTHAGLWLRAVTLDGTFGAAGEEWSGSAVSPAAAFNSITLAGADGSKTVTVRYMDKSGNIVTASDTIVLDTTEPTVSSFTTAVASPTNDTSIAYTLTFSESVSGIAAGDFVNAGTATGCTFTPSAASGSSISVTVTTCSTTGTLIPRLATAGVSDAAGNTGPAANADGSSLTLDRVAPTVSSFTSAVSSPTNDTSITYTLTFSESVSGIVAADFANAGTATGCTFTPSAASGSSISVTVTTCSTTGTLQPRLTTNSVTDAVGNTGPAANADATTTLTLDRVAPTVSSFTSADATPTNALSATYTLAFSESVTGLASSDLTNGGTAANCAFSVTGTGASYTVTVNGCADSGTLRPRLATNGVSDLVGNAGPIASADASTTITIDRVAPTVSWTTPVTGSTYTSSTSITVVWTASDAVAGVASLSLTRERVAITNAGLCAGGSWAADGASIDVTGESSRAVTGLLSGYCYRWVLDVIDAADNSMSSTSGERLIDTSAPSLVLTATGSGVYENGSTVYFRAGTTGTLSLGVATEDAQSGVASVTFGSLSSATGWSPTPALPNSDLLAPYAQDLGWDATAGSASMTIVAANLAGGETSVTKSFVADGAAPVVTFSSPSAFVAQYATTISLVWSESDAAGVASRSVVRQVATPSATFDCAGVSWSTDGAPTSSSSPRVDTSLATGCYRFAITLVDNVGNSGTAYSAAILVDTTPPPTPTLSETGSGSYLAGSTLFFRAGSLGTLTLSASTSDPTSGIASITFSGTPPSGWTMTPSLPTADTTAPYSIQMDWAAAAAGWTIEVTAQNGAGAVSSTASLSLVADTDDPSATISSPAGATIAASSALTLAWSESDGTGAGVASRSIQRERAAIPAAGSCTGASFSPDGAPTTATSSRTDTGLASGFCYRFAITLVDRVGNSATIYSGTVLIDTSAPTAPSLTASGSGVYQSAANGTVWFRPSAAATLTLIATAVDAESGVDSIVFGALSVGTDWSPAGEVVDSSSPYGVDYTFSGSALSTGLSVTARNGASESGAATEIDFSADAGAPVGGFSAPATVGAISDDGTFVVAWNESDAGSGVASRTVIRQRVAAVGGSCPASGWVTDGTPTTAASPRSDSGLLSGFCVRWVLTLVDRVGNEATTTSQAVLVDSSAPDAPVVTAAGAKVYQSGDLVWFGSGSGTIELVAEATDAESGIASVTFGALSSATGYTPASSLPYSPTTAPYGLSIAFTMSASSSGLAVSATNGVAVTSNLRALTFTPDRTDPVASVIAPTAFGIQASTSVTVSWSEADVAGSGIASRSILLQRAAISASGSCTGSSWSAHGAPTTAASPRTDSGLASGYCYRFAITLVDNVGNTATVYSGVTLVDSSASSAPAVTAAGAGVYQASADAIVFFRPAALSTILFTVTATDDESGIGAIRFGALSTATGWTPSSAVDVAGAPYQRSYAFSGSAAGSSVAISALNGAGTESAATTISLTADSAAPLVAVIAPATTAVQAGSSITMSWTEDDDGGAGVASRSVIRYHAAIPAAGSCAGAIWSADGGATSTASPRVDAGLSVGCYRYGITATDRVGNGSTTVYTAAVLVDATAPDAPALGLSGTSGTVYAAANGTTWFAAAGSGSMTLTATAADADSGVASITFAALSGATSWSPANSETSGTNPAARTYAWSAGASAATFSVSATNGTGSSGDAASITLTPDAAAPSVAWTSPTPSTTNPSGTATTLIFSVTDSGSGVASSSLQRQRAAVVSGACPDVGSFANDGPALVAPVSMSTIDTLLINYCYRWVLTATDQVGQGASAVSGTILVTSTFSLAGIPGEIEFALGKPGDLVSAPSFSATAVAASAYELRIEVGSMTRVSGIAGDLIPADAFRFLVDGSLHTPSGGVISLTSGAGTGDNGTVYAITPRLLLPFVSVGTYSGEITFVLDGLGE